MRSLTTEDSSEVCVKHVIWKTPANVKLVQGWWGGGNVDGGGPLKLTIISLSTSRVKRTAGKIKLSGEGGENGVVWLRLGESYPKLDEISLCVSTTVLIV